VTELNRMIRDGDFVELDSSDEYTKYLNIIDRVCKYVDAYHTGVIQGGDFEAKYISTFLEKLRFTMKMFRLKCLHNSSKHPPLDLNESGFPNYMAFSELETDLKLRDERLSVLPIKDLLIEQMIDHMISKKTDPSDLLGQMADRNYLEQISKKNLFLPYNHGGLELRAETEQYRKYVFSWACYDFSTNMPYCHVLAFDQDIEEERFENLGQNYIQFLQIIKSEGSRTPTIGVMASSIDNNVKGIHPKVLKRVRVGPILSANFSREKDPEPLIGLLKEFGQEDDFAVKILSEIIFSSRQENKQTAFLDFGRAKKVREVFAIPSSDIKCFERSASKVYENIIMPHHFLQLVIDDPRFAEYEDVGKVVYSKEGNLYVV
jgi:hypothetical protein